MGFRAYITQREKRSDGAFHSGLTVSYATIQTFKSKTLTTNILKPISTTKT